MEITIEKVDSKLVVNATGRIDTITAKDYDSTVIEELDSNEDVKELVLNFENINYISSVGLRAIMKLQKRMATQGTMKVTNVSTPIMEVFEMTGFTNILTIEEV